ncbi:30S ribosomal protein S17 [Candidatus Woesearchaeota archaeon]|nr:30S ribosomal protein S17 [Candidatus Woesearchaeota archaeon]
MVNEAVNSPKKESKDSKNRCEDKNCPFHGNLNLRGREFKGKVISCKANKTITVQWDRKTYIAKYERYEKKRSAIKAHNPPCLNAKLEDIVKIKECRPLSKTKKFCVIEVEKKK